MRGEGEGGNKGIFLLLVAQLPAGVFILRGRDLELGTETSGLQCFISVVLSLKYQS